MHRYYIAESNDEQFNAANKARQDVESCFKELGYNDDDLYIDLLRCKNSKMRCIIKFFEKLKNLKSGDYIFLQYPYYKNHKKVFFILRNIKRIKKINIVAVIHDLDCLRYKKSSHYIKEEVLNLNLCDNVISHNEEMTMWLIKNGCKTNLINLGIFDYLIERDIKFNNERKTDIVIAGNLDKQKSGFVYKIINNKKIDYKINLYGPNFNDEKQNSSIKYKGKFSAEDLIENIEGKFGLIWDGDSLEECKGDTGDYTLYNNPHKLSMYVAAELPIICWSKMSISKFVKDNKIGLSIDSLEDLDNILNKITEHEYNSMLNNLITIKQKIISGYFIKKALNSIN